jgi:hypothetical protein
MKNLLFIESKFSFIEEGSGAQNLDNMLKLGYSDNERSYQSA